MRRTPRALAAGLALAVTAAGAPVLASPIAARPEAVEVPGEGTLELVREGSLHPPDEAVLRAAVSRLNCAAMQPRQGTGKRSSDWFDPPPRPELYTAGIAPERLRELAAELVGADGASALTGALADRTGAPPAEAVSGWGSAAAPRVTFVPRAETPFDLDRDARGAGVLVVEGDLHVWSRFDYRGLVLVLGSLAVMDGGSLTLDGVPLFAETLAVYDRGNLRLTAGESAMDTIRRVLARHREAVRVPFPTLQQVQAPVPEPSCDL